MPDEGSATYPWTACLPVPGTCRVSGTCTSLAMPLHGEKGILLLSRGVKEALPVQPLPEELAGGFAGSPCSVFRSGSAIVVAASTG